MQDDGPPQPESSDGSPPVVGFLALAERYFEEESTDPLRLQYRGLGRVSVSYWPDLPSGIPVWDERASKWTFVGAGNLAEPLRLEILEDRKLLVGLAGEIRCLTIGLRDIVEVEDFLWGLENAHEAPSSGWTNGATSLDTVIESMWLSIPSAPEERRLIRLENLLSGPGGAERRLRLREAFCSNSIEAACESLHGLSSETVRECTSAGVFDRAKRNDYVCTVSGHHLSYFTYSRSRDSFSGELPSLILRLRPGRSFGFFHDYFGQCAEAADTLERLFAGEAPPGEGISGICWPYPRTRQEEIGTLMRWRNARQELVRELDAFFAVRVPSSNFVEIQGQKAEMLRSASSETLDAVRDVTAPLPSFLAWPLRRYRRADKGLEESEAALRLQSSMLKSLLFLLLEELGSTERGREVAREIEKQLEKQQFTDGTIWRHTERLAEKVARLGLDLPVFGVLASKLSTVKEGVDRILDARNDAVHGAFDSRTYLSAFSEELGTLVEFFRSALSGVTIVLPTRGVGVRAGSGERFLTARVLMGHDIDFPERELAVPGGPEDYPLDALVALAGRDSVVLGKYFAQKKTTETSRDVGLLNGLRGGAEYVFVRG